MSEIELAAYSSAVATVGDNFKRIRTGKGMRQEQLYRSLGFKRQSNVSLLERSKKLPKPRTIAKMARAIGCEPWELLVGVVTPYDELREKRPPARRRAG